MRFVFMPCGGEYKASGFMIYHEPEGSIVKRETL